MIIFEDEFYDNRHHWRVGTHEFGTYLLEDGGLCVSAAQDSGTFLRRPLPEDTPEPQHYVLETVVNWISGISNNGYGVCLATMKADGPDYASACGLYITPNGYWKINGVEKDVVPWKQDVIVRQGTNSNTLKIERSGPMMRFYINDYCVAQEERSLFGDSPFLVFGPACLARMVMQMTRVCLKYKNIAASAEIEAAMRQIEKLEEQIRDLKRHISLLWLEDAEISRVRPVDD